MLHFVFCLHNHQPVGNFGFVLENAHRQAYVPFLDVFQQYDGQKAVLHFSGILYRWLEANHPEYLDRLSALSRQGRVEFLAGGFYEPILAVIPEWDRIGQVRRMVDYLKNRFNCRARGLWLAERVWEPDLPRSLAGAGIDYVVVDDYHLRAAGVIQTEITRPYLTAHGDHVLTVFGGSERLRYSLPYDDPEKAFLFLRQVYEAHPDENIMVAMADDGEKFGVWPGTHQRVYGEGWFQRFYSLMAENGDWIQSATFSEALSAVKPAGTVFMPTVSYMEMSEWALPPRSMDVYRKVKEAASASVPGEYVGHYLRGGYWRNFLSKYPESRHLWGRMNAVSRRLHELERSLDADEARAALEAAREELWQAQCNDAYWHGVFGGLYLPFLRAAAYEHLIKADSLLDSSVNPNADCLSVTISDINVDGREEIIVADRRLAAVIDLHRGSLLELDYRKSAINLCNAMTRRPESYHERIRLLGDAGVEDQAKSIHHQDKIRDGLRIPEVAVDEFQRLSFADRIWLRDYAFNDWRSGRRGAMIEPAYKLERQLVEDRRISLEMVGSAALPIASCRKVFRLKPGQARLEADLHIEIKEEAGEIMVGLEFNLTPTSIRETRVEACGGDGIWLEPGEQSGELDGIVAVRLTDTYTKLRIVIASPEPRRLWYFPLCAVSNSEAGYEEIPQQLAFLFWDRVHGDSASLEASLNIEECI